MKKPALNLIWTVVHWISFNLFYWHISMPFWRARKITYQIIKTERMTKTNEIVWFANICIQFQFNSIGIPASKCEMCTTVKNECDINRPLWRSVTMPTWIRISLEIFGFALLTAWKHNKPKLIVAVTIAFVTSIFFALLFQ